MIPEQGAQGTPQGAPGTPGREAEDVPVDGPSDSSDLEADIAALLSETERERDEYLELAQRTKADFENYRKRMAAEVQAASVRGKAELVSGVIGVIDNLERGLEAAGIQLGAEADSDDPLSQGIVLTYRELCSTLERAGVEAFDPAGERFDPSWHEALQKLPADGTDPGTVLETMQKGYRLGEQLIRPARVVVSE